MTEPNKDYCPCKSIHNYYRGDEFPTCLDCGFIDVSRRIIDPPPNPNEYAMGVSSRETITITANYIPATQGEDVAFEATGRGSIPRAGAKP